MVFKKQEAISFLVTTLGWLSAIVSCVLPVWRVTFPDEETNPDAGIWEGLWHMCQVQGYRWIQCTRYDTQLPVAEDLEVSRVFMVFCTIGTCLGLLLCVVGDSHIDCLENTRLEDKVMKVAGGIFLGVGLLVLIPLSWVTHNIIHGFFNPLLGYSKKAKMGTSLYLAWTSSLLLLLGGILLCVNLQLCRDPSSDRLQEPTAIAQMFDGHHTYSWSKASSRGLSPGSRIVELEGEKTVDCAVDSVDAAS